MCEKCVFSHISVCQKVQFVALLDTDFSKTVRKQRKVINSVFFTVFDKTVSDPSTNTGKSDVSHLTKMGKTGNTRKDQECR